MRKNAFLNNKQNFFFLYFTLFVVTFLIILKIFSPTLALAAEVTIKWDFNAQATGYKLHYGFESKSYGKIIDVGLNLQHTISGLDDNQMYYFAATSYNEFGESDFSEEISYKPVINQPPIADAGPDQTVNELAAVTLSGSNSIDPDDGIAEFLWEQLEGTIVNLVNPGEEGITFTAPDVVSTGEALIFKLLVTDSGNNVSSDTCIINVSSANSPPEADAGIDLTVLEGELVTLDASNSSDLDNGIYSYQWSQISGTPVELSISNPVKPTFISPDVSPDGESLKFQLTVTDPGSLQSQDTCIVNVSWINEPPIADAGTDQAIKEGEIVTLDGSGSKDVDDGIVSCQWSQTSGPPVSLSSPAVYQPTFTAPAVSSESVYLTFDLTIIDKGKLQAQDSCTVEVNSISDGTSDIVEINEALYDASRQKLSIKAKSNASANSVVLSAWAKFDSKDVELGKLRYDKKKKLYSNTFRKIKSKPINITVKSSGGGIDTQP